MVLTVSDASHVYSVHSCLELSGREDVISILVAFSVRVCVCVCNHAIPLLVSPTFIFIRVH